MPYGRGRAQAQSRSAAAAQRQNNAYAARASAPVPFRPWEHIRQGLSKATQGGTAPLPPPPVGGRPLDPAEESAFVAANRGMAVSQAGAAYQRGQLEQEYGYGASGAANPYSRAALLEESYKRSKLGTTNSYAGSGQLYSGAYGRMQNENARNYSIGVDQNRRQFDNAVYGLNLGQAQTAASYGMGVDQASFEALLRALGAK